MSYQLMPIACKSNLQIDKYRRKSADKKPGLLFAVKQAQV